MDINQEPTEVIARLGVTARFISDDPDQSTPLQEPDRKPIWLAPCFLVALMAVGGAFCWIMTLITK